MCHARVTEVVGPSERNREEKNAAEKSNRNPQKVVTASWIPKIFGADTLDDSPKSSTRLQRRVETRLPLPTLWRGETE